MRKHILGIFVLVLCCIGCSRVWVSAGQQTTEDVSGRVLFISSYSYAWETVPQQIEGIKEALGDDVVLDYKFMDTKNVNTEESKQLFYESMRYHMEQVPAYDIIIVGDDAAFQFAMQYKDELFFETPIVFEGVNHVEQATSASADPYVTGVIESLSYGDTIELAHRMYPQATQVVAILDDTVTGEGERIEFYKYDAYFPTLDFLEINASVLSQEELKSQVEVLGEESILLYIMCSEDGDGNTYASAEAIPMLCESAQIPTFSIVSIGMGKGFVGGEIVSQKQMGKIAGDMAMQVLRGADCAEIALVKESPKMYCFDENVMNRFGIKASALPQNVEIINHKESFLERNKRVILIALVIVVLLLFLIAILAVDNMRRRKMNNAIREANEQLTKTARYDTLTRIYNRGVFIEDLNRMIASGEHFGVIMYDLDNFKQINDLYGHNEGDAILQELAKRSKRLADEQFTVYRLAGDEFTAIVKSGDRAIVETYMKTLYDALQEPYNLGGRERGLNTSIGAAMWPIDGETASELVAAADTAMYYIKKNGKNGMTFYEKCME